MHMKNTQKGFAIPLLIAIIAGLVVGGYYIATHNKSIKTEDVNTAVKTQDNKKQSTEIHSTSSFGPKTVTFISPKGGEKFTKGKTYKITWTTSTSFNSAYPQVSITLITAKGKQAVTPEQQIITKNSGSFEWTVPTVKLNGSIQDTSGGPYALRTLDSQTEFQFLIEGYPHTTGRAEGPYDYTDGSFQIISQ